MKHTFLIIVVMLFALILNSCKKDNLCYKCSLGQYESIICEDDYDTKEDFNNAKDLLELVGYQCKKKY